jgi:hypothetical protein
MALVNMVMSVLVAQIAGKFLNSCTTGGFSKIAQLQGVRATAQAVNRWLPTEAARVRA